MTEYVTPEDEARYMEVMAAYDEHMRQEAIKISKRKACDHFTNCRDCGRFTDKSRWVRKDSIRAINKDHRPLCAACFDEYDTYY